MKKRAFIFLLLTGVLISCSDDSKEFELAAKELCSCMTEGETDASDAVSANMSLGLCLLDSKVDLKDPKMAEQINEQCPEFKDGFQDFVKELK